MPYNASATYPHFDQQQTLYFEYQPKSEDNNGNVLIFEWENDFSAAKNDFRVLYMPIFMAHEFGHAAGLWHSPGASDVMTSSIASNTQNIHNNDKKAMKALYDNHTSHK